MNGTNKDGQPKAAYTINDTKKDIDAFELPGQHANIIQPSDLPSIVVPGVGATLNSFSFTIQNFLGLERRLTISGELTVFNDNLRLTLRRNHHVIFSKSGDPNDTKALMDHAAVKILNSTEPSIGAIAHNNYGNSFHRNNMSSKASEEYRAAIDLDPNNALYHYNLANVLYETDKMDASVDEYRVALRLDLGNSDARINLGYACLFGQA